MYRLCHLNFHDIPRFSKYEGHGDNPRRLDGLKRAKIWFKILKVRYIAFGSIACLMVPDVLRN